GWWHATGFVAGAFASYERRFRRGFDGLARVGYKYRNLGAMPGLRPVTTSPYSAYPTGTTNGPIRDSSGRALASDFSLFYLGLGLGKSWGTRGCGSMRSRPTRARGGCARSWGPVARVVCRAAAGISGSCSTR